MVEKNNSLFTINYGTTFLSWNISFKVCNNACIMHSLEKNHFHQFLLSVFKMNDTVNFEDNFVIQF